MNRVAVPVEDLRGWGEQILQAVQIPAGDAALTMDSLLDAEMSGLESHGVMRLKTYVDRVERGLISPQPNIQIHESGAVARVDGGDGLGQVVMARTLDFCLEQAKTRGLGVASISHSNHFGAAAYYTRVMAEHGCVGLAASSAGPTMAPFGGMDLLLGTNPFSIAFPGKELTFCADMASSATAKGKIRVYEKNGRPIPLGWALDAEGNDTTDAAKAVQGILLPMGGHKGYALAMAVDAVCGLLSGASLSCESQSMFQATKKANIGHFIMVLDIAHFLPLEDFQARAQDWFDRLRSSKARPGFSQIMIPGEPEALKRGSLNDSLDIMAETLSDIDALRKRLVTV